MPCISGGKRTKEDGKEDSRVVLKIPAKIAPIKLAILPLLKKEGLPEIAKEIMATCRNEFYCFYEEKDNHRQTLQENGCLGNTILYYHRSSNERRSNSNHTL